MRKVALATILFLSAMFLSVAEDAYAHGFVPSKWTEVADSGIVCSTDGAYTYVVRVVEEAENKQDQKGVVAFLAGPNFMQALNMRLAIKSNPETLRKWYSGNGILIFHLEVLFRYSTCEIETRRIKFVSAKNRALTLGFFFIYLLVNYKRGILLRKLWNKKTNFHFCNF